MDHIGIDVYQKRSQICTQAERGELLVYEPRRGQPSDVTQAVPA
jgi:hypothetical protein